MYYIADENEIPENLILAHKQGKTIQVLTIIGYVDVDDPEWRVGANYRVKEDSEDTRY